MDFVMIAIYFNFIISNSMLLSWNSYLAYMISFEFCYTVYLSVYDPIITSIYHNYTSTLFSDIILQP